MQDNAQKHKEFTNDEPYLSGMLLSVLQKYTVFQGFTYTYLHMAVSEVSPADTIPGMVAYFE